MRQYILAIVVGLFLVAWQSAWPSWATLGGCRPDLAIALVVCVGMLRGPTAGAWLGLVVALLVSSLQAPPVGGAGGAPLGGLIVSHIAVGTGAWLLRANLLADRPSVAMLITLVAVPAASFIELLFVPPPEVGVWLLSTLIRAPYTALLAAPIYLILQPLLREPTQPLTA